MATAPRNFDENLYYHIYNCGVEKREIFLGKRDYYRLTDSIDFYLYDQRINFASFQKLNKEAREVYLQANPRDLNTLRVKIIAYCFMPNHFHFLLKAAKVNGITKFISDITNSYTRYFNIKNERIGGLLQGTFKTKEIASDESLLQVTRYIHLNPVFSSKTNPKGILKPENYIFSSYCGWIMKLNPKTFIDQEGVAEWVRLAGGREKYQGFVESKIGKDPSVGIENFMIEKEL